MGTVPEGGSGKKGTPQKGKTVDNLDVGGVVCLPDEAVFILLPSGRVFPDGSIARDIPSCEVVLLFNFTFFLTPFREIIFCNLERNHRT